ncbi:hypothetical protein IID27_00120 [Patescibacteria group bacterium]|nr:hypothetical protein [Patescibacteria group bacterium]
MFNLFNAKAKSDTNVLFWIAIAAFFVIIGVALLTQAPIAYAQLSSSFDGRIVACDGFDASGRNSCNLCTLLETAQNIINFLVFFAIIVAVLMFVYAGFLLVTAGSNEGQISKGKSIFWTVFIGLFVILAAWLIINLIMSAFLNPDFGKWYSFNCSA